MQLNSREEFQANYKKGKFLGDGGQGHVFQYDPVKKGSGLPLAVKTVKESEAYINKNTYRMACQLLEKETKILASLTPHESIISYVANFTIQNSLHLITECCVGGCLFDYFVQVRKVSEGDVKSVAKQLLSAIEHCHSHNVVHRDVKLENILLARPSDFSSLKLIDFGISVGFNPASSRSLKRQIGSTSYRAPEIIQGLYDEKCDIWALGVTIHILLLGYPPFLPGPEGRASVFKKVKNREFSMPDEYWKRRSQEAKHFCLEQLLKQDYKTRESASQLLSSSFLAAPTTASPTEEEAATDKNVFEILLNYRNREHIIELIHYHIVLEFLSTDQKQDLETLYHTSDIDGDGKINEHEFGVLLDKHCNNSGKELFSNAFKKRLFKSVDTDGNGTVDFQEFCKAATDMDSLLDNVDVSTVFQLFDKDKDGDITGQELFAVLKTYDPSLTLQDIKSFIEKVDLDNDSKVSQAEFKELLVIKLENQVAPD